MTESTILDMTRKSHYFDDIIMNEFEEYRNYLNEFEELCAEICSGMPKDEQHKMFLKFEMLQSSMEVMSNDEHFKRGFKLGLTIAAQNLL